MLLTTVFPSSVLIGLFTESCFQVHIDFLLKAPSDMSALGICTFFCIKKQILSGNFKQYVCYFMCEYYRVAMASLLFSVVVFCIKELPTTFNIL